MPKVYQFHRIKAFPNIITGEVWRSIGNLGLPEDCGEDEESTSIQLLGDSEHQYFYKYFVKHETVWQKKVKVNHEERNSILGIEEFHIYIPRNFTYAYITTNGKSSHEVLRRIRKTFGDFDYSERMVDLQKLKNEADLRIRGAWFTKLPIDNVSTAAIFGGNVTSSAEFQKYGDLGEIAALNLELFVKGKGYSLVISRTGSITLHQNLSERESLEFIEQINDVVTQFADEKFVSTMRKKGQAKTG